MSCIEQKSTPAPGGVTKQGDHNAFDEMQPRFPEKTPVDRRNGRHDKPKPDHRHHTRFPGYPITEFRRSPRRNRVPARGRQKRKLHHERHLQPEQPQARDHRKPTDLVVWPRGRLRTSTTFRIFGGIVGIAVMCIVEDAVRRGRHAEGYPTQPGPDRIEPTGSKGSSVSALVKRRK